MMLKTDFTTTWFVAATAIVWIAYDIYAFRKKGSGYTESEVITTWSIRLPSLAFLAGVVAGHFFWPQVLVNG